MKSKKTYLTGISSLVAIEIHIVSFIKYNDIRKHFNSIVELKNKIKSYSPFNLILNLNLSLISITGYFSNSITELEDLQKKLGDFDAKTYSKEGVENNLLNFIKTKLNNKSNIDIPFKKGQNRKSILVFLIPNNIKYFSLEREYKKNKSLPDFYFIQKKQNWEQPIIKAICSKLGLADENDDGMLDEPSTYHGGWSIENYFNLIYSNDFLPINIETYKWKMLHDKTNKPLSFSKLNSSNFPISNFSYQTEDIVLIEGGAGFKKNIYRSSNSCLMQYSLGSNIYPIKLKRIPLCIVCEAFIREKLLDYFRLNSKDQFEFRSNLR